MKCVNAMPDDIVVLGRCVLVQQGPGENEISMSTRYVLSMIDESIEDGATRSPRITPK